MCVSKTRREHSNEHILGFVVLSSSKFVSIGRVEHEEPVCFKDKIPSYLEFGRGRWNEQVLGFVVLLGSKRERSNEHRSGFVVYKKNIYLYIYIYTYLYLYIYTYIYLHICKYLFIYVFIFLFTIYANIPLQYLAVFLFIYIYLNVNCI